MTIMTSRAKGTAQILIDHEQCILCGRCVNVCCGKPLYMADGKVQIDQERLFGCIGCGHCMAVCPKNCIKIKGRELSPDDCFDLPDNAARAKYPELKSLMSGRRSVRRYLDKAVEQDKIDEILDAAASAPSGYPPSDVKVLVINGREKVTRFAFENIEYSSKFRWMFSPLMRILLRPFVGRAAVESYENFIYPALGFFVEARSKGEDWLLYGAPVAMLFYGSAYSDPCDPYIAATYAMLAAESLGLGSCMIGSVAPFLRHNKKLKEKYGIAQDMREGLIVLFGYSAVEFRRGIRRTFADVKYC